MDNQHLSTVAFAEFPLHQSLQDAIKDNGFEYCTPIQAESIKRSIEGRDLAGQAQTGTGKTAAFLLCTFDYLMQTPVAKDKKGPWALILAPTRELAVQIQKDAELFGVYTGLDCVPVYGGAPIEKQKQQLADGADVVIGTPGRIIDLYKQRCLNLRDIEVVVMDEADRMFDLGFIDDIRYLLRKMPPPIERRNMLFSATLSARVMELAYEHMNDPGVIKIESEQVTADNVEQVLYHLTKEEKPTALVGLMRASEHERSIVFVNTKRTADEIEAVLVGNEFTVGKLSGDLPQKKRESVLKDFQEGKVQILVATDVAARGIHIPKVSHVYNYDLPQDQEDYVHRIGRTARAGESGKAISLACDEYVYSLPDIEKYIEQQIPTEMLSDDILNTQLNPSAPIQRSKSTTRNANSRSRGVGSGNRQSNHRSANNRRKPAQK